MASVSYAELRNGRGRVRLGRLHVGGNVPAITLLAGSLVVAALLRLAMRQSGASAIASPLDLPASAGAASAASTWGYVLFQSTLLPHPILGTDRWTWGGGALALTLLVLALAFRAGLRARPARLVAVVAPTVLVGLTAGAAELVTDGARMPLELAPLTALLPGVGVLAAVAWERLEHHSAALPWLRAASAAAFATPAGILVAALPVLLLAPAAGGPGGAWLGLLAPYVPNAILRAAFGAGTTPAALVAVGCFALAAVAAAIHLRARSLRERFGFLAASALLLAAATAAATPAATAGDSLLAFARALPPAAAVGAVGAVLGPMLGGTAAGHRLARIAVLRALGDRLPPPSVPELTAEDMVGARPATHDQMRVYGRPRRANYAGRAAVAVATAAVLLAVLVVGAVTLTGTGSEGVAPELAAARTYLDATSSNQAGRIWPAVTVDASALPATAAPRLLGRDDLARMLAVPGNQRFPASSVKLTLVGRAGAVTLVRAQYQEAGVLQDDTLRLTAVHGAWKVILPAAAISIAGGDAARIAIDGAPVTLLAGQPVFVLPGVHSVEAEYAAPFGSNRISVVSDQPYPATTAAAVPPRLDDAAVAGVRSAVAAAFQRCAAAVVGRPARCPQGIDAPASETVRWAIVGDPLAAMAVAPDAGGGVIATGGFQMVGAYNVHIPEDVKHVASAGGFRAALAYSGGAWSMAGGLVADGRPTSRPGAADADLLAAVRAGFNQCLGSHLLRPADCPQTLPSTYYVKDVAWRLDADPLQGAQTAFDAQRGVLTVSGLYAMTCSYNEGGQAKTAQSSGHYRADLLWDGAKVVLVAINRG